MRHNRYFQYLCRLCSLCTYTYVLRMQHGPLLRQRVLHNASRVPSVPSLPYAHVQADSSLRFPYMRRQAFVVPWQKGEEDSAVRMWLTKKQGTTWPVHIIRNSALTACSFEVFAALYSAAAPFSPPKACKTM